jgi:hypothetical protein
MRKGIDTNSIVKNGNNVCRKCNRYGYIFMKNDYADIWSKRTKTNSRGEVGWYCKCKKCGGTKNLGKRLLVVS